MKILFIGHSAGYTGAPIILLKLVKWFFENTDHEIRILLKSDGPLRGAYEKISPVFIYNKKGRLYTIASKILPKKILHRLRIEKTSIAKLKKALPPGSIDCIFSNTITNGKILSDLEYLKCPIVCRVAELNYWIQKSGRPNLESVKKHVTHYIAVSNAVKENLVNNISIPSSKIDVVHGFITFPKKSPSGYLREKYNIPKDAIIVGGSGAESWRKGKDIFIQLAVNVLPKAPRQSFYFVWIGGQKDETLKTDHDILYAGLNDRIFFIPEISNPMNYFCEFDIFTMTSREDPYPIVNLEIASLSIPILCFDGSGGSPEFVEDDAGFVIPYLDIKSMADKIILLAKNKELRIKLGERAAEKVRERHDINVAAPSIHTMMTNLISKE